jgi:hypothetical protein
MYLLQIILQTDASFVSISSAARLHKKLSVIRLRPVHISIKTIRIMIVFFLSLGLPGGVSGTREYLKHNALKGVGIIIAFLRNIDYQKHNTGSRLRTVRY